jgi:hypothetical protein
MKKKNSFELRYDLIPFGYVGNLVFFTKYSHTQTQKKKKKKKRGRENGTFINKKKKKKMNVITS